MCSTTGSCCCFSAGGLSGEFLPLQPGDRPGDSSALGMMTQRASAHLDVLQEDAPTPLILQLHQLLSMFTLLMGLVQEVLGKVFQSHIIPVKIVGLKIRICALRNSSFTLTA